MPRGYLAIAAIVLLGILLWFVPLVRITSLSNGDEQTVDEGFNVARFAERHWNETIAASHAQASDAVEVLGLLTTDPDNVQEQYGRSQGVRRGYFLYLRGSGQIVSVDRKGVALSLTEDSTPQLLLKTGPIFGNAIRDATGLVESSELESTQQWNELSELLNRHAEEQVAASLFKNAEVGKSIDFVVCAEVKEPRRVSLPLTAVPVWTHIQ